MTNVEELVNKLAFLQRERKSFEDRADDAVHQMGYNRVINELEEELEQQKELRDSIRRPFEEEISKINEGIEDISNQIVYIWDSKTMKKTMKFPAGILTLRTTQSLDIKDPAILLDNLLYHFSTNKIVDEYLSGFKKTPIKQFMAVISQPLEVVELVPKTTVKLEVTE